MPLRHWRVLASVHLGWSAADFWACHPQIFFEAIGEFRRFNCGDGEASKPARPTRDDYEKFKIKYAELIARPGDGSVPLSKVMQ